MKTICYASKPQLKRVINRLTFSQTLINVFLFFYKTRFSV